MTEADDDLFYSSMRYAMAQPDPIHWLEGYRYCLIDAPFNEVLSHRRQVVLFLQACLQEKQRSTYNDSETVFLENSHV